MFEAITREMFKNLMLIEEPINVMNKTLLHMSSLVVTNPHQIDQ